MRRIGFRGHRGMTIVEAAIATVIVGGVLVAAMTTVAASRTIRGRVADRVRAQQLALDLMSEILQQGFANPGTPAASRAAWSYVTDYNGLVDSPPQTKSGTPIPDVSAWARSVTIQWANPTSFVPNGTESVTGSSTSGSSTTSTGTNTGIYFITVTVSRGNLVLASVNAYRTSAWVSSASPTSGTAPIASATASPLTGGGGHLTVNFSGAGSIDPAGNPMLYSWNFGDGTTGTGETTSHTYSAIGTYSATLTVSDNQGGMGVSSVNVTVSP